MMRAMRFRQRAAAVVTTGTTVTLMATLSGFQAAQSPAPARTAEQLCTALKQAPDEPTTLDAAACRVRLTGPTREFVFGRPSAEQPPACEIVKSLRQTLGSAPGVTVVEAPDLGEGGFEGRSEFAYVIAFCQQRDNLLFTATIEASATDGDRTAARARAAAVSAGLSRAAAPPVPATGCSDLSGEWTITGGDRRTSTLRLQKLGASSYRADFTNPSSTGFALYNVPGELIYSFTDDQFNAKTLQWRLGPTCTNGTNLLDRTVITKRR